MNGLGEERFGSALAPELRREVGARDCDHWDLSQLAVVFDNLQKLPAIHVAAQEQVEQNDLRPRTCLEELQRPASPIEDVNVVAPPAQQFGEQFARFYLVIDDQNSAS